MSLSPINMFQSNQSSLAAILQGGSQTITKIMDDAIQIGRDISNNQRAKEQDLITMRQQEKALEQRRAENAQKVLESNRNFEFTKAESDRNYGLAVRQENRLGRASAGSGFDVQRSLNFAAGTSGQQAPVDKTPAVDLFYRGDQPMSPVSARPTTTESPTYVPSKSLDEAEARLLDAKKAKNNPLVATLGQEIAKFKEAGKDGPKVDEVLQQTRSLNNETARLKAFKEKARVLMTNSEAFVPTASWLAQKYGLDDEGNIKSNAVMNGKPGASPEELRSAQAYKTDPVAAEMAFADQYGTAEEYADALQFKGGPEVSPKARQLRIKFWNEYMATQRGDAATDDPWKAMP